MAATKGMRKSKPSRRKDTRRGRKDTKRPRARKGGRPKGRRNKGEGQAQVVEVRIKGGHVGEEGPTEVVEYGLLDTEDIDDPTEASIDAYFPPIEETDPFGFELYKGLEPGWTPEKGVEVHQLTRVRWGVPQRVELFFGENVWLIPGDEVIVETDKGQFVGEVVSVSRRVMGDPPKEVSQHRIVRRVTAKDRARIASQRALAQQGLEFAAQKAKELGLNMKFFHSEVLFTGDKLMLYFIAPQRVDFRRLVRILAAKFSMRIELRQMGVRDEAKMIGGLGPCGQPLCCTRYLDRFDSVSIKMAKAQNMVLNTQKLSGQCGRLKCCLAFEMEVYEDLKRRLPRKGETIKTPRGEGTVVDVHLLKTEIKVDLGEGEVQVFRLDDLHRTPDKGDGQQN